MEQDEYWMRKALKLALIAYHKNEVPVGALLVQSGKILSTGYNCKETLHLSLAHAEIIAIKRASNKLGQWRLLNTTLYVTLEPCIMCAGSLLQARVSRVVFGAYDPKGGAFESLFQLGNDHRLNHRIEILGGILEQECSSLLKDFFIQKRKPPHIF